MGSEQYGFTFMDDKTIADFDQNDIEHAKNKQGDIKENEIYKALEAMIALEVTNLNELIGKLKNSKSRTSKTFYDKKIKNLREKILKYMFQLNRLSNGEVEQVLDEIEAEKKKETEAAEEEE